MTDIFKAANDMANKTGQTGNFWDLVESYKLKEQTAVNMFNGLSAGMKNKIPKSKDHWYSPEIHTILGQVESNRPANAAIIFETNASAGAFRSAGGR